MEKYTLKMRGTPTDGLADVIQSLQLIHKSGLLVAERDGPSNSSELGRIAFHHGQVIDAEVGQLRGAEAFRNLLTWTSWCFIFEPLSDASRPLSSPPTSASRQYSQKLSNGNERLAMLKSAPPENIPYRSRYVENMIPDFQRLGLSRAHRQLFLLIDGKRTPQELARLVGRHPQEISSLLLDLERIGLIGH